ncbi:MAG: thiamine phosphate synthase [Candidatus Rokuibacteriota bacterium]|nr:MAG: thiamine phosphate synthase [Candidatus Rokubacteria bacterium]
MTLTADFGVYLVTDLAATRGRPLVELVAACLEGGVRAVQLRAKEVETRPLLDLATALRRLTARHGARLLVNDRADVALAVDADGVQLPGDGLPVAAARRLLGAGRLVAASTHSVAEAESAAEAGADFVVFGPVYDTPSKRRYGPPQGLKALGEVCRRVARLGEIRAQGATGVAVIRALLDAEDARRAAAELVGGWRAGP